MRMAGDFVHLLLFRTQGLANDGIVDRIESKLLRRCKIQNFVNRQYRVNLEFPFLDLKIVLPRTHYASLPQYQLR